MLLSDARLYQILFLSLFLMLGISTRDWALRPEVIVVSIVTCLLMQCSGVLLDRYRSPGSSDEPFISHRLFNTLPSALITALGLSLLLRADHLSTMMLASSLAILSKFLLQVHGKHIFNPANFGIVAALTLTQDAWVSPGQWGAEGWYALLFLGTGGLVLKRVGRWDTSIAFLAAYAGLEAIRNVWLGWTWDVWLHRLSSGSLLLFALFMITDPRTIPNARVGRLCWAIAIALLTFILRNYFFIHTAVFWALFSLTPLTLLLNRLFPATQFSWLERSQPSTGEAKTLGEAAARETAAA
jgi:Na+-transporting NADH:ubiquinone oxidoreductase subunit NqrB